MFITQATPTPFILKKRTSIPLVSSDGRFIFIIKNILKRSLICCYRICHHGKISQHYSVPTIGNNLIITNANNSLTSNPIFKSLLLCQNAEKIALHRIEDGTILRELSISEFGLNSVGKLLQGSLIVVDQSLMQLSLLFDRGIAVLSCVQCYGSLEIQTPHELIRFRLKRWIDVNDINNIVKDFTKREKSNAPLSCHQQTTNDMLQATVPIQESPDITSFICFSTSAIYLIYSDCLIKLLLSYKEAQQENISELSTLRWLKSTLMRQLTNSQNCNVRNTSNDLRVLSYVPEWLASIYNDTDEAVHRIIGMSCQTRQLECAKYNDQNEPVVIYTVVPSIDRGFPSFSNQWNKRLSKSHTHYKTSSLVRMLTTSVSFKDYMIAVYEIEAIHKCYLMAAIPIHYAILAPYREINNNEDRYLVSNLRINGVCINVFVQDNRNTSKCPGFRPSPRKPPLKLLSRIFQHIFRLYALDTHHANKIGRYSSATDFRKTAAKRSNNNLINNQDNIFSNKTDREATNSASNQLTIEMFVKKDKEAMPTQSFRGGHYDDKCGNCSSKIECSLSSKYEITLHRRNTDSLNWKMQAATPGRRRRSWPSEMETDFGTIKHIKRRWTNRSRTPDRTQCGTVAALSLRRRRKQQLSTLTEFCNQENDSTSESLNDSNIESLLTLQITPHSLCIYSKPLRYKEPTRSSQNNGDDHDDVMNEDCWENSLAFHCVGVYVQDLSGSVIRGTQKHTSSLNVVPFRFIPFFYIVRQLMTHIYTSNGILSKSLSLQLLKVFEALRVVHPTENINKKGSIYPNSDSYVEKLWGLALLYTDSGFEANWMGPSITTKRFLSWSIHVLRNLLQVSIVSGRDLIPNIDLNTVTTSTVNLAARFRFELRQLLNCFLKIIESHFDMKKLNTFVELEDPDISLSHQRFYDGLQDTYLNDEFSNEDLSNLMQSFRLSYGLLEVVHLTEVWDFSVSQDFSNFEYPMLFHRIKKNILSWLENSENVQHISRKKYFHLHFPSPPIAQSQYLSQKVCTHHHLDCYPIISPVLISVIQQMMFGSQLVQDKEFLLEEKVPVDPAVDLNWIRHLERTLVIRFGEIAETSLIKRLRNSNTDKRDTVQPTRLWGCPNTYSIYRCLCAFAFFVTWHDIKQDTLIQVEVTSQLCRQILDDRETSLINTLILIDLLQEQRQLPNISTLRREAKKRLPLVKQEDIRFIYEVLSGISLTYMKGQESNIRALGMDFKYGVQRSVNDETL